MPASLLRSQLVPVFQKNRSLMFTSRTPLDEVLLDVRGSVHVSDPCLEVIRQLARQKTQSRLDQQDLVPRCARPDAVSTQPCPRASPVPTQCVLESQRLRFRIALGPHEAQFRGVRPALFAVQFLGDTPFRGPCLRRPFRRVSARHRQSRGSPPMPAPSVSSAKSCASVFFLTLGRVLSNCPARGVGPKGP